MILPHIDQASTFANKDMEAAVEVFVCPGRGRPLRSTAPSNPGAWTDYFINPFLNDPNGDPNSRDIRRTLSTIYDGASQTIAVGHGQINPKDYHATSPIPGFTQTIFFGGSPGLCRPNLKVVNQRDSIEVQPGNWGGPFSEGSLMVMADGSARVFPYSLIGGTICDGEGEDSSLSAFLTPGGGELSEPFRNPPPRNAANGDD